MDVSTRAVLTAALAALLAVAAFVGELPLAAFAALCTLLFALGWPVLLRLPSPLGSGLVIAIAGLGSVAAVFATRGHPVLRELPIVVALAVLLAFVNELARQDGRRRLVESVTGTVTGILIVCAAAGWVASGRTPGATSLVVTGAVALAFAAGTSAVPLTGWAGAVVTVVSGVVGGGAAGLGMPQLDLLPGIALGLAAGVLMASLRELLERVPTLARKRAAIAAIVLPVAVSGTVVYVVGRVFVG
ncbi:hypothetical protein [Cellulomonas bogoriensis]|uniref:Permease n=1 Tax=Cellulomonas bogoriensis 69B4 = DSM 16987 TaxID=1386082 RepID=A0A0A0C0Z1_9CELL|nr:hypothetical protein [Cellulomonas bogoriensis]KGM13881.1 hypothetical protein N869_08515 [Cellulomonas bogoriensis 69B4 = DSM 16987]